jgi:hypothetical protein
METPHNQPMTISASACCTVSVYGKVATEGCDLSRPDPFELPTGVRPLSQSPLASVSMPVIAAGSRSLRCSTNELHVRQRCRNQEVAVSYVASLQSSQFANVRCRESWPAAWGRSRKFGYGYLQPCCMVRQAYRCKSPFMPTRFRVLRIQRPPPGVKCLCTGSSISGDVIGATLALQRS